MFSRFFKKKSPSDQREHYRRAPGKKAALGVKLITEAGEAIQGELLDVSAGGAAVSFEADVASELEIGAERELRFTSLTKGGVRVRAVIRSGPREDGIKRYGFQFLDPGALFEQLDDSFYKYFNRRRWPRAQPALDRAVKGEIAFGEVALDMQVHDISREGVAFVIPSDVAEQIQVDTSLEVVIRVPKSDAQVLFYGLVRHKSLDANGARIGCSLEPRETDDNRKRLKKDLAELEAYIQRRVDDMERYNTAFN